MLTAVSWVTKAVGAKRVVRARLYFPRHTLGEVTNTGLSALIFVHARVCIVSKCTANLRGARVIGTWIAIITFWGLARRADSLRADISDGAWVAVFAFVGNGRMNTAIYAAV